MKYFPNNQEGCRKRANSIFNQLSNHIPLGFTCSNILDHLSNTLIAIDKEPIKDLTREWTRHNTRYGYHNSTSGVIAECVAAFKLVEYTNHEIEISITKEDQYDNGIDFWIYINGVKETVQVKAIIINNDTLRNKKQLQNLKTDWVSLVDIDNNFHLLCETNMLIAVLSKGYPTKQQLIDVATQYFDNTLLSGTPEDQIIKQKMDMLTK
jgi:hypothetical protein